MTISILILSLVALTAGAEALVRGSSSLAIRAGLTPLTVGLTIVAFGTSAPELTVSLAAALKNQADISVGNLVGSNIFNIGVILGLTALICPIKANLQILKQDAPIMVLVSGLALFLISRGSIGALGGLSLLALLAAYTIFTVFNAHRGASPELELQFQEGVPPKSGQLHTDLAQITGGLILLVAGSSFMVSSASELARSFGISEAVIGLTIVSMGTSMPELATSLIAALRRQPDIAVGNVIGSNIFNILGILGLASLPQPLQTTGITNLDLWTMMIFSIALLPLLYTGLKLQRGEGALLLGGYGIYLWLLWP